MNRICWLLIRFIRFEPLCVLCCFYFSAVLLRSDEVSTASQTLMSSLTVGSKPLCRRMNSQAPFSWPWAEPLLVWWRPARWCTSGQVRNCSSRSAHRRSCSYHLLCDISGRCLKKMKRVIRYYFSEKQSYLWGGIKSKTLRVLVLSERNRKK